MRVLELVFIVVASSRSDVVSKRVECGVIVTTEENYSRAVIIRISVFCVLGSGGWW
jgi:hypothetical protein